MELKPAKSQSVCGTCIHWKYIAAYKEVCHNLGIGEFHVPCVKYLFNFKLIDLTDKTQQRILNKIGDLSNSKMLAIADLLRAERTTRGAGFYYLQPVYVHLFGDRYLSNFAKGWVIMAAQGKVYMQGSNSSFYGVFSKRSVIKEKKFLKMLPELLRERKYKDPNYDTYVQVKATIPKRIEDVPTIDRFVTGLRGKKGETRDTGSAADALPASFTLGEFD